MKIKFVPDGVCASKGFYANGVHCGIRKNRDKRDLALIFSEVLCNAAAVYTQNKVKGAPIYITQKNLANNKAQAVIVNSGNANTCNADGEIKAQMMCDLTANSLGINADDVIVASTGVIGQVMPIEPIAQKMEELAKGLSNTGNDEAAEAILTTDTFKKEVAVRFEIDEIECHIGGMAKGSGMIHPNMATMLCFLTTDVNICGKLLQKALSEVIVDTFNMVSVDGDTSTNDMVSIMSSGLADNKKIRDENSKEYQDFKKALFIILEELSKNIAKDGEGATKLLTCSVSNASDKQTARVVAKSVITSSLFKSAMFGQDANWGRILCAIGYAEAEFAIEQVAVSLSSEFGQIQVCKNGSGVEFSEEEAAKILTANDIKIMINLGGGKESATAWGCDLTYDYVKINGDYRT